MQRRSRIYTANRTSADDEGRITDFYKTWKTFIAANSPQVEHVWNTDEIGDFRSIYSVMPFVTILRSALGLPSEKVCHVNQVAVGDVLVAVYLFAHS